MIFDGKLKPIPWGSLNCYFHGHFPSQTVWKFDRWFILVTPGPSPWGLYVIYFSHLLMVYPGRLWLSKIHVHYQNGHTFSCFKHLNLPMSGTTPKNIMYHTLVLNVRSLRIEVLSPYLNGIFNVILIESHPFSSTNQMTSYWNLWWNPQC